MIRAVVLHGLEINTMQVHQGFEDVLRNSTVEKNMRHLCNQVSYPGLQATVLTLDCLCTRSNIT